MPWIFLHKQSHQLLIQLYSFERGRKGGREERKSLWICLCLHLSTSFKVVNTINTYSTSFTCTLLFSLCLCVGNVNFIREKLWFSCLCVYSKHFSWLWHIVIAQEINIFNEISPGCSSEGLMLKLKLQYFGQLMWRADSFEKTLTWTRSHATWPRLGDLVALGVRAGYRFAWYTPNNRYEV